MNKITVLGSINMDMVLKVTNMVQVGETVISNAFIKIPGGKGANQAVACSRLGSKVNLIGKIGKDENGSILFEKLKNDKINLEYVKVEEKQPTGMAMIQVNNEGDNSIVVIPGANMTIEEEQIKLAEEIIKKSKLLIAQFETPMEITNKVFKLAKRYGVTTILNPAPAKKIYDELLANTDIIIPNETEAYEITNVYIENENNIKNSAKFFLDKGVSYVIITLGERGAAIVSKDEFSIIPAYRVNAIDTTAAGDSFIGGIASKLSKEENITFNIISKAIEFGNKVSSIAVQKQGAQTSIPYLEEVEKVFKG